MKPSTRTNGVARAASPPDEHLRKLFQQYEADTIAAHQKSLSGVCRKETDPVRAEHRQRLLQAVRLAVNEEVRDV